MPEDTATSSCIPQDTATSSCTPQDTATSSCIPQDTATSSCIPQDTATASCIPQDTATSSCLRKELPEAHSYLTAVPNSRHHTCRRNPLTGGMNNQTGDTERQQQQQHIKQLASYIDERAAHYNQGRTTTTPEPYPKVNWARLKPHSRKSLPQPIQLPLSSCPQDSNLYPDFPNPQGRIMEWYKPTTQCFLPGCQHTECLPPADSTSTKVLSSSDPNTYHIVSRNKEGQIILNKAYRPTTQASSPFGTAAGFETNLGTVAPPEYPIDGYIYTQRGWILHATPG